MNSSIDVFYFNVSCTLHNLINYSVPEANRLSKEDFRKFWDMLGADKTFKFELSAAEQHGGGFKSVPSDIEKLVVANGFTSMGSTVRAATSEHVLLFGSKSVNNLPLMFEVSC